jgi:hypothetical protein
MDVLLSHTVPQIRLRDRAATLEHEERHVNVIPQKKIYFLPPDQMVEHQKAEVWIDSWPGADKDINTAQHYRFHIWARS